MKFTVLGPVGYVRMNRRSVWTARAQRYISFKKAVQAEARKAGLRLPLVATKDRPVLVATRCSYPNAKAIPDCSNVQKAAEDALCYGAKGGDKYVAGFYAPSIFGVKQAIVEILVIPWGLEEEAVFQDFMLD